MGWKASLVVLLAIGCHSENKSTTLTGHVTSPPPSSAPSAACERRATEVVDGLVDHVAAESDALWDALYNNSKLPPPTFIRTTFAAFLQTADGKRWVRGRHAFDTIYRGLLQHCDELGS